MTKLIFKASWLGFIAGILISGLNKLIWMDIIGQEASIARIENGWIDSAITMPIQIGLLLWVLWWWIRRTYKYSDEAAKKDVNEVTIPAGVVVTDADGTLFQLAADVTFTRG